MRKLKQTLGQFAKDSRDSEWHDYHWNMAPNSKLVTQWWPEIIYLNKCKAQMQSAPSPLHLYTHVRPPPKASQRTSMDLPMLFTTETVLWIILLAWSISLSWDVSWYRYSKTCLLSQLLMEIWVVSNLRLFWIRMLQIFLFKALEDIGFHASW